GYQAMRGSSMTRGSERNSRRYRHIEPKSVPSGVPRLTSMTPIFGDFSAGWPAGDGLAASASTGLLGFAASIQRFSDNGRNLVRYRWNTMLRLAAPRHEKSPPGYLRAGLHRNLKSSACRRHLECRADRQLLRRVLRIGLGKN